MKKLLVLTCILTIGSAAVACAQGISLAWRNCIAITSGPNPSAANADYACDGSLPAPFKGVISFRSPATLEHFVGIQAVIDLVVGSPVLPDWWRLGIGECRDGNLTFPASLSGIGNTTTCRNPWAGATTGGGFQYQSEPYPGRARVLLALARDTETSLQAGQEYIAGAFTLDHWGDVPDPAELYPICEGCSAPACLVMSAVELYQTAGSLPQDVYYLNNYTPSPGSRIYVTWQGGAIPAPGCPAATPARNASWGSVKALYR